MLSSAMRRVAQPAMAKLPMGVRGLATEASGAAGAAAGSGMGIVGIAGFLGATAVLTAPITFLNYQGMKRLDSTGTENKDSGLDGTKLIRQHMRDNHNGRSRESNEGKKDMEAWKRSDSRLSIRTEDNAHLPASEASGQADGGFYLTSMKEWAGISLRNVSAIVEDPGMTKGGMQRKRSITHFNAEATLAAAKHDANMAKA